MLPPYPNWNWLNWQKLIKLPLIRAEQGSEARLGFSLLACKLRGFEKCVFISESFTNKMSIKFNTQTKWAKLGIKRKFNKQSIPDSEWRIIGELANLKTETALYKASSNNKTRRWIEWGFPSFSSGREFDFLRKAGQRDLIFPFWRWNISSRDSWGQPRRLLLLSVSIASQSFSNEVKWRECGCTVRLKRNGQKWKSKLARGERKSSSNLEK